MAYFRMSNIFPLVIYCIFVSCKSDSIPIYHRQKLDKRFSSETELNTETLILTTTENNLWENKKIQNSEESTHHKVNNKEVVKSLTNVIKENTETFKNKSNYKGVLITDVTEENTETLRNKLDDKEIFPNETENREKSTKHKNKVHEKEIHVIVANKNLEIDEMEDMKNELDDLEKKSLTNVILNKINLIESNELVLDKENNIDAKVEEFEVRIPYLTKKHGKKTLVFFISQ